MLVFRKNYVYKYYKPVRLFKETDLLIKLFNHIMTANMIEIIL